MSTAADNHLLLRALCDEFARCGMTHACTSPGSRNSPIVVSLVADDRISCWSHLDERCAGFFAVGIAKARGLPVAVTCTSGTAAANLAPAVIEAFHARLPLIVLTADRPAELRDVGAGQAIDQLKLYGDAVKWFCEVSPPDASVSSLRWIRQLACRSYWTALDGRPGPVHLNLPLREPLVLDGPAPADPLPGRPDGSPWVKRARPAPVPPPRLAEQPTGPAPPPAGPAPPPADLAPPPTSLVQPPAGLVQPLRGVIVAGRFERGPHDTAPISEAAAAAARLAERAGWPLLADPLSGARHSAAAIATYDLLLRSEAFAERSRPEIVIRVGDLPTSKPLRTWLAGLDGIEQLAIDPEHAWQDPAAAVTEIDTADPVAALDALGVDGAPDATWLAAWRAADADAADALATGLGDELSEPAVARLLGEALGPECTLFCAASMPIRDLELYLPAGRPLPRVLSNRGANGIDGTVSSAFGVAAAGAGPVVLLIGDVALAHDIGGLLAARRHGLQLTIIVLNNDGGGIFHFLPISGAGDAFAEHIATPHGLRFEHAAALYGLGYEQPRTRDQLAAALTRSVGSGTTTIIEVATDREHNLELHGRLADVGLAALDR